MELYGYIVIVLAISLVLATIIYNVRKFKKNKGCGCSGSCSGNCADCCVTKIKKEFNKR